VFRRDIPSTSYFEICKGIVAEMELDEDISMGNFDSNTHEAITLSNDTPSFNLTTNGHEGSVEPSSFIDTYEADDLNMPIHESEEQSATQNGSATTPPHKLSIVEAGDAIVESEETPTPTQTSDSVMSGDFTPNENVKPEVIIRRAPDPILPYSSSRTGLVYDARMRFHTELGSVADDDIHPEDPRRIWVIFHDLVINGLVDPATIPEEVAANVSHHPQRLLRIPARLAEPGEICLVHSEQHYEWVESLAG
jgi:histone deacetylase 6